MTEPVNPMVVDLSHWDPADDYEKVRASGIVGVIYKATEGQSYTDPTYVEQQHAAKAAGLLWGAYHFADGSDVQGQIDNFMAFASPDPDELFVLDWEDNPSGAGKMSVAQAKEWINAVEAQLDRPGECVIYGGNTLKEMIEADDEFFAERRLWLCQYGSNPTLPSCWDNYWLWQYTDGVYGPSPHTIDGIGPCDINSFDGDESELAASWAPNASPPKPRPPQPAKIVGVDLTVPSGIDVSITVNGTEVYSGTMVRMASRRASWQRDPEAGNRWRKVRERRRDKEAKE